MKSTAKAIMRLSDIYISERGSPKIWEDEELVQAYLNYFMVLNSERALAVLKWAEQVGFTKLFDQVVEFGSGPGTLHLAAHALGYNWAWHCLEASTKAKEIHAKLAAEQNIKPPNFIKDFPMQKDALFMSSYVLNEAPLPSSAYNYDSIFILEPSTQSAARNLMQVRSELIERGYHIWAPCTHQDQCPLLKESKKDWCHVRIHWQQSLEFQKLESELPIKNNTLTLSYLLASKKSAPKFDRPNPARVIGDTLYEKGKVRQALCRGDKREFLSWLKRFGEAQPYLSGELIHLPDSPTIKGNEIRINTPR